MLRMNMAVGEGDKHFSGPGSLKSASSPDPKNYLDQKIKRGITKMWLELESSKKGDKKAKKDENETERRWRDECWSSGGQSN